MKILLSGSSGLIGGALSTLLRSESHTVIPLVRHEPHRGERFWDPDEGTLESGVFEGIDAFVHLGGRNIASTRWSAKEKERIWHSRVESTKLISQALTESRPRPRTFVCASATGYYGDRGDEWLTEDSSPGEGFLSDLCVEWERATAPAAEAGIRVVNTRFGVVLSEEGGALAKALPPFKAGLGGVFGDGEQFWSWISLHDTTRALNHILRTDSISGPLNVVSPNPVRNRVFTKTLGDVISRPTIIPVPAFAARLMLGEMADATLLASARVSAEKLRDTGFTFDHPDIESALSHVLQ